MIYLDNNATTPVAPEVLEALSPFLSNSYGNPSSHHSLGRQARRAVDAAREQVACFLNIRHVSEIHFTSGGTESNHMAIRGFLRARPERRHLVTTRVEHSSVLSVFQDLEREGYSVSFVDVDQEGRVNSEQLFGKVTHDTALVSLMYVNNETGVISPVEKWGQRIKEKGAAFHVDAVQAGGKLPLSMQSSVIDFLSLSGHKLHAPKGVGVLYVRQGTPFAPPVIGGGQEWGRRGGTENVPAIVGFGRACQIVGENLQESNEGIARLRDHLERELMLRIPGAVVNGSLENRVANTTNISFPGLDSEAILLSLDREGVCASGGAACHTGAIQLSHVLTAMGYDQARIESAVRFSLSRYTTRGDISAAIEKTIAILAQFKELV